jgi:glycogen phosphorylase
MKPIGTFLVRAALPAELEPLRDVAYNLQWAWNHRAIALFRRLDADAWERAGHNPLRLLDELSPDRLEEAASDEAFLAHLAAVSRELDGYRDGAGTWYRRTHGQRGSPLVAYFSAEFGITDCLPIFAGGLGVLAGDHLKAASDLGLPLLGVGLLYQQGYFHQYLNQAGWQQESYNEADFRTLPLIPQLNGTGDPLLVAVPHPGREVAARVWRAEVGRVPLFLLDTNIAENLPEDRAITDQLYGGDLEVRIRQEIVLGIGGVRALAALGLDPPICHMNEGHSAFAALERARLLMRAHGIDFAAAREATAAGTVFTTHTPVPAGHDNFEPALVSRYLGGYLGELGLGTEEFLALGQPNGSAAADEAFSMTVLALRLADVSNGVSRLHGSVSRRMWHGLWPGVPEEEVPVGHITNGVHLPSWISYELDELFNRYLGPRWREERSDETIWSRSDRMPSEELWRTHERRRERLVAFARARLTEQLARRGAADAALRAAGEVLDPAALTIGFARRFATYKRALLLFSDLDRLHRILNDAARPVQVIIAGKAHPRDEAGKELIRRIIELTGMDAFRRSVVFLEDYDMATARYLVQGSDVWLNTPRRPLEASGTSGMKAAANGVLNLSVLDGWWVEAWEQLGDRRTGAGWAIGSGEVYTDHEEQDRIEGAALYALLENEIVPTFYHRGPDRLPREWIVRMKQSIARLNPQFNATRLVSEYTERYYLRGAARAARLLADGAARAGALAAWKRRVAAAWDGVGVETVAQRPPAELLAGASFTVTALVRLGGLQPEEVGVELCIGRVGARGVVSWTQIVPMKPERPAGADTHLYEVSVDSGSASGGTHGYTVRARPSHQDLDGALIPGLITWAGDPAPEGRPAPAEPMQPQEA